MLMTLLSLDMILLILGFENCNKIFGHLLIWKTLVPWPFFSGLDIPTVGFFSLYKYTKELIDPAHLIDSKNVDTPMEVNVIYHRDYGRLYWTTTRPGISYGQFFHLIYVQSKTPLIVVFCIIKYLHGTLWQVYSSHLHLQFIWLLMLLLIGPMSKYPSLDNRVAYILWRLSVRGNPRKKMMYHNLLVR